MNLRAYAKINIGLRILEKRADGYHSIETIFYQINLYDGLTLDPSNEIVLTSNSANVPLDSSNLCIRAALLLKTHTGYEGGVKVRLTKGIPLGAGLGGGSSDAAAMLVGLNRLWKTGLTHSTLESLAGTLGSDVPFFIQGGTAVGTSRGELLEKIDLNIPYWIVTVTPPIHVSTAWAYANIKIRPDQELTRLREVVESSLGVPTTMSRNIRNDFEELVERNHPEIRTLRERLMKDGAVFAQLSGSGSSVYGFFHDESTARNLLTAFPPSHTVSLTPPNFKPVTTYS
jgi:4-diphosphocytidyl-2-C-methyl-D-erythritol kinase